jgi:hypothetical protein
VCHACVQDVWCHMHSLMPMRDAARVACLSRAFLRSWRCHPNLTLTRTTLRPKKCLKELNWNSDRILRNHSGIGLKTLELNLGCEDRNIPYFDSWLQVAVKLHTCVFRPTSELGAFRRLTNLKLDSVRITGDELECFLSNSLALEQMELCACNKTIFLKIPWLLHQLSSLTVMSCYRLQVIECKAPNLSIIDFSGEEIKLSLEHPLKMKKLHLDYPGVVNYARAELPSIMPNLETLLIDSCSQVLLRLIYDSNHTLCD